MLAEKPEAKKLFGGPRYRWEDHIEMDLRQRWK